MTPLVRRFRFLVACSVAVAAVVGIAALGADQPARVRRDTATTPSAKLTSAQKAKLERKAHSLAERRFDAPDLAVEFYVNKRTGPIVTRGANPTLGARPLSPAAYLPALQQMRAMPRFSSATGAVLPSYDSAPGTPAAPGAALSSWSNLGPGNQGGRTRALIINPSNNNIMYAGGVGGGVWKSTDAGANWLPLADLQMSNIAVASLAFDPLNANTIYAGTGEGFFNGDAIRGAGIFKSTDAGVTWNQLASTNNADFHYTMSLVVSPRNTQRLFAATRTGVFRSIDGGASWTSMFSATAVNGCTQVVMQVSGPSGFVFAACGTFAQGTIQRATDDNVSTFTSVFGLTGQGRSSIAVAPSNESVVYVMASQATAGGGTGQHGLHGIYRSAANGDLGSFTTQVNGTVGAVTVNHVLLSNPYFAFSTCAGASAGFFNQGWYDNVIAVDPLDANRVWAGGVDLFRSDDGGLNWGTAGYWWATKGVDPEYHHADQHGIVFHPQYNGTSNKVMFSMSDGGVERIDDARAPVNTTVAQICGTPVAGSPTWFDRNNGYVTSQFYDGAVYPNGLTYFGGLQDNGTQRGASGSPTWTTLSGGDGGYVAVDTLGDANAANDVLFAEFTGNSLRKSTNGGTTFAAANSGITGTGFAFIAPFAMNQGSKQHIWIGGYDIWRSTNQAGTWARATGVNGTCGNGSISAIAAHPLDANRVLVGMSDGCYHYNHAALTAPNTGLWPGGGTIAAAFISAMAWDPANINVAYAAISRFGAANLYKTTDGGVSWLPRVGSGVTSLPQIPALSVVVNPTDSLQVFVGTDLGVFTSVDGGASWYLENTGFSNVPVESLKFNETAPHTLFAFTHGRGAWRVALNTGGPVAPAAANDSYNTAFNTQLIVAAPGVLGNDSANGGGTMTAVLDTTVSAGAGTLSLNLNGGFTYTPVSGFSGPATFTYHAANTNGSSNIATVTITVAAAAPPPTATNDSYNTPHNTTLVVTAPGVLANDNTNGGGTMTAGSASVPSSGTLSAFNTDGSFTYTPATGFSGSATFTYRASNSNGPGNTATVTVTVAPPTNTGPGFSQQPVDSTVFVGQSAQFSVAVTGSPTPTCQWQSSDNLGASWTSLSNAPPYSGVTTTQLAVSNVTLAMSATQFRCLASNTQGTLASSGATLSVAVVGSGGTPSSGGWTGSTSQSLGYSFTVNGGTNITPVDILVSVPACGFTVSMTLGRTIPIVNNAFSYADAPGSCTTVESMTGTFASPTNASGILRLRHTPAVGCNCIGTTQVSWNATSPAAPPQFLLHPANQTRATGQNAQFTVAASGSPAPTFQWEMSTNGGGSWINVPATSPYSGRTTPTLTILGTGLSGLNGAQFRARAQNASGPATSNPATLTVSTGGSVPTAVPDSYSTAFNTLLTVAAPGVLGNDNSNGGGAMTAAIVAGAAHGSAALNADGSFSYTPSNGFSGGDSFTYRASNGAGPGSVATVSLTVGTPGLLPPTSVDDSYGTAFNGPLTVAAPGVLGNDNPNTGGAMTAAVVTGPLNGGVTLAANGGFSYTPSAGFSGPDSFTYRASNGGGPGNVATVAISVAGPSTPDPQPPTNFRVVSMVGNTVTFAWTPPTSGATPTGYQIEGGLAPAQVLGSLPLGNTPAATLTLPSGALFLRMRTLGGGGVSALASNELLTFVNLPVPPSAPANLLGLVVGNTLNLAWTPTFGGGVPTNVILDVSGAVTGSAPLGPTDTFSFPGVPAGTYTLSVRAVNASGSSASSPPVTLTFPTACSGAPQPVANFLAYKTGGTLFLNWDPPASGTAPTSYLLNVTGSFVGSIPTSLRALSGAVPAGTYNFSVVATNACGASAPTAVQTVSLP